jgi:GTP pyrophosphokinase
VYDLFAIRIIVYSSPEKEKEDCWKVYSLITDEYTPSPERLRDWLSNPKSNGYEALHTTVMGPQGRWVEVQIRTNRMNEIAEKGLAAHYKYKEGSNDEDRFDKWFAQIREVISSQDTDSVDFLQDLKRAFLPKKYMCTHQRVTLRCCLLIVRPLILLRHPLGCGKPLYWSEGESQTVPISHKLRSGDQVEIITSNKQKPSDAWLKFVVTAKAKSKIKDSLKEEKRKIADDGKYILQKKLEGVGAALNQHNIDELVNYYKAPSQLDLFLQYRR